MKKILVLSAALALCPVAGFAQDAHEGAAHGQDEMAAMMEAWQKAAAPGEEHAWLAKGVGTFSMKLKSWGAPDAPPMETEGMSKRAMILGGRVLEERIATDMMGQPFEGIARIGYDNVTGRYWNTWIDSMSTGAYVGHGERGEDGALVLHGEYANPMGGGMIKTRSVTSWKDDNTQVFEWYEDHGAGEMKTMEIVYTRGS